MTYKLEPGLARISSPIVLVMPDGEKREYGDGKEMAEAVFDHRLAVGEIRAINDEIEIILKEPDVPDSTFF